MSNLDEVLAFDSVVHIDADDSAEVEEVTLYLSGNADLTEWKGSVQVFRAEPLAEDEIRIKDLRIFVSRGVLDVNAHDVTEVEMRRDKGEDPRRIGVTRVRYEDAGGFELVLS
jgi:hypothetical protein